MVAPKKKTEKATVGAPSAREFTVVLEDIRSQFKVFGEALGAVREEVHEVKRDLVEVKRDLVEVKRDLLEVKHDLVEVKRDVSDLRAEMHAGFAQVDHRLEGLERDMGLVKSAILEQRRELGTKVSREEVERMIEHAASPSRA